MKSKLILLLILHICLGQWNSCFDDNEGHSKDEIKQCFLDNASLDPCNDYECNLNSACNSSNLNDDVACIIDFCQRKCKSKEKPCVIECLNLDSCSESETEEEYLDCIRNFTVNGQKATDPCDDVPENEKWICIMKRDDPCFGLPKDDLIKCMQKKLGGPPLAPERSKKPIGDSPRRDYGNKGSSKSAYPQASNQNQNQGLSWWLYLIIGIIVVFVLLLLVWPMLVVFRTSNPGNVSSQITVIDPRTIPKGAYPVQTMPTAVSAQGSQQSLGQGVTPYPSENQFEPQSKATKRGKLPGLPEQKRVKSKL